jgi:adenosylcobinamide-GDP ribazoletransferase
MNRSSQELRYFFTALGYFTRVPVPRWVGFEMHYLNAAARYFPLIGAIVGGLGAVVYLAALQVFPAAVAVLLSMAATLLVTGAFHEDGLAAFGAIALIVVLALKWQTLATMLPLRTAWMIVAAHAASRTFAISYLCTLDYVRAEGKAKPVAQKMSAGAFLLAALFGLPWLFWPDWRLGCVMIVALGVLRFAMGRYFVKRIGGYTGDCLGFAQQIFELAIYLIGLGWISS